MELAGQEEKWLAIENNDLDLKGNPKIAVIADGAWSKRLYKTNYNALSGVVSYRNNLWVITREWT